jgi:hypothetical protein
VTFAHGRVARHVSETVSALMEQGIDVIKRTLESQATRA